MAVCVRQWRIMHARMQSEKRRDKIAIESIIMVTDIRQQHKRMELYEAIMNFFDQKQYGRSLLYTISRSSDPA